MPLPPQWVLSSSSQASLSPPVKKLLAELTFLGTFGLVLTGLLSSPPYPPPPDGVGGLTPGAPAKGPLILPLLPLQGLAGVSQAESKPDWPDLGQVSSSGQLS